MFQKNKGEVRGGKPPRFTLSEMSFDSLRSLRTLRLLTRRQAPALSESKGKAVFLDRDGVLARLVDYPDAERVSPRTPADFEILSGAKEFVREIKNLGYRAIVITNQSGIADGSMAQADLDAMHTRLKQETGVDDIFVCPHAEAEQCSCRKPKPGMILDAAQKHDIDLARSFMVGDWWRDMEAGKNAGVKTILFSLPSNTDISGYDYLAYGYDGVLAVIARSPDVIGTTRQSHTGE